MKKEQQAMNLQNTSIPFEQFFTFFCLFFIFSLITLQAVYMLCSTTTLQHAPYYALGISCLSAAFYVRNKMHSILYILSVLLFFFFAFKMSFFYPDFSWDGLWYHQPIANAVQDGINIFKTPFESSFFSKIYPKALEIFAGEMQKISPAKMNAFAFLQILLCGSVFSYSLLLSKKCGIVAHRALIFAFLCTFTPLFFQQMYAYLVDYNLYCLSFFILTFMILYCRDAISPIDTTIFFIAGSLAISTKASGCVYPCAAFLLIFLWDIHKNKSLYIPIKNAARLAIPIFIVGITVLGYQPYMTNILQGKHIVHPLNQADMSTGMVGYCMPKNFAYENRFAKVFMSLTGKTTNDVHVPTEYKNPFVVYDTELYNIAGVGTRVAGWGPLFFATVLFSGLMLVFYKIRKDVFGITLAFILLTTFIHPHGWLARFAPQVYLIPLFTLFSVQEVRYKKCTILAKGSYAALICLLLANIGITLIATTVQRNIHHALYADIAAQANAGTLYICTKRGDARIFTHEQLFTFYDIDRSMVNTEHCQGGMFKKTMLIEYVTK